MEEKSTKIETKIAKAMILRVIIGEKVWANRKLIFFLKIIWGSQKKAKLVTLNTMGKIK